MMTNFQNTFEIAGREANIIKNEWHEMNSLMKEGKM